MLVLNPLLIGLAISARSRRRRLRWVDAEVHEPAFSWDGVDPMAGGIIVGRSWPEAQFDWFGGVDAGELTYGQLGWRRGT